MDNNQVVITLTPAQVKALKRIDLLETASEVATACFKSRVKGDFKRMTEKAEELQGRLYDQAVKHGGKFDKDRGTFINTYLKEMKDILSEL